MNLKQTSLVPSWQEGSKLSGGAQHHATQCTDRLASLLSDTCLACLPVCSACCLPYLTGIIMRDFEKNNVF